MKHKLTLTACALSFAFCGTASAKIASSNEVNVGQGELFFTAWEFGADTDGNGDVAGDADDRTFIKDIGNNQGTPDWRAGTYEIGDFTGTGTTGQVTPNAAFTTGSGTPILSFDLTLDANYNTFINGIAPQNRSKIQYQLTALDSTGSAAGNKRVLTTVNGDPGSSQVNLDIGIWNGNGDVYLQNANLLPGQLGTTLDVDASSQLVGFTDAAGSRFDRFGNGPNAPATSGFIGTQLDWWLYYNTSTDAGAPAGKVQFANATAPALEAYWQLQNDGTLIYAVPVPEPGTWAMLAAGLLAVGGIARRRLSA